jgi:hypothetical protein
MFINTIVIKYPPMNLVDKRTRNCIPETNLMLFYGMENYIFNNRFGEIKYMEQPVELRAFESSGIANTKEYLGVKPKKHWRFNHKNMLKMIDSGEIYKKGDTLKFIQEMKGKRVGNFMQSSFVSGYYPTQKSFKLLERVILLSTI